MNKSVLTRVRKTNFKKSILNLIYVLLLNFPLVLLLYSMLTDDIEVSMVFLTIFFGIFAILADIVFYKTIKLVIYPEKSDIFKKYGNVDKIQKIIDEINTTKIYEDKNLIISENYICDRNDIEKIVKCSDILGIYKEIHKVNYIIDCYKIIIIDKYGQETSYAYKPSDDQLCNQLLHLLSFKCKNAKLGYTQDVLNYVKNNKISLPKKR